MQSEDFGRFRTRVANATMSLTMTMTTFHFGVENEAANQCVHVMSFLVSEAWSLCGSSLKIPSGLTCIFVKKNDIDEYLDRTPVSPHTCNRRVPAFFSNVQSFFEKKKRKNFNDRSQFITHDCICQPSKFADLQFSRKYRMASDLLFVSCKWRYFSRFWASMVFLFCNNGFAFFE